MTKKENRLEFVEIPPWKTVYIACSGGPDSMAIVDWYLRHTKKYVCVLFFNHGTHASNMGFKLLDKYLRCHKDWSDAPAITRIFLEKETIYSTDKPRDKSWEEYWRDERLKWLNSFNTHVLTGHNLDDAVETWVWSSLHGQSKLIPYRNGNILRPLLLTKKSTLKEWCDSHNVPYFIDPGNEDRRYMRSIVRHDILPHALKVNPGLYKVVKKKLLAEIKNTQR